MTSLNFDKWVIAFICLEYAYIYTDTEYMCVFIYIFIYILF